MDGAVSCGAELEGANRMFATGSQIHLSANDPRASEDRGPRTAYLYSLSLGQIHPRIRNARDRHPYIHGGFS